MDASGASSTTKLSQSSREVWGSTTISMGSTARLLSTFRAVRGSKMCFDAVRSAWAPLLVEVPRKFVSSSTRTQTVRGLVSLTNCRPSPHFPASARIACWVSSGSTNDSPRGANSVEEVALSEADRSLNPAGKEISLPKGGRFRLPAVLGLPGGAALAGGASSCADLDGGRLAEGENAFPALGAVGGRGGLPCRGWSMTCFTQAFSPPLATAGQRPSDFTSCNVIGASKLSNPWLALRPAGRL
mmetsp:Transcript_49069/g.105602  ORF Transcript_49069/g.105602 Transcript_49069/m.105602 type:complete len:243 (-) Transcript_49069:52-780(-)